MALLYMLDTNIISDIVSHPSGKVIERLSAVGGVSFGGVGEMLGTDVIIPDAVLSN